MTTAVKICGITTPEDACMAANAGADYLGLVFSTSPRKVELDCAKSIIASTNKALKHVGVFVDEPVDFVLKTIQDCHLDFVQLQGSESPEYCQHCTVPVIKGIHVDGPPDPAVLNAYNVHALLFDTSVSGQSGGTGITFDWSWLDSTHIPRPFFLAGGLNPQNVASAISDVRPYGVDVSSGVAREARLKNPEKVRSFVRNAKRPLLHTPTENPFQTTLEV